MQYEDYRFLYDRLNRPEDIDRLHMDLKLDRELLLVLYTQKTVRGAIKNFYRVKADAKRLLWQWNRGRGLVDIAQSWNFPPILTAYIILREKGMQRKQFWRLVNEPEKILDKRLKREIESVKEKDMLYSPKGMEVQYERGRVGEKRLQDWLDKHNIKYRIEKELKKEFTKTPDALLDKPLKVHDMDIWWIESKASFGDEVELRKNLKRQLQPYIEMFGSGMVVYWFGFVDGIRTPEGVIVVDGTFFEGGEAGQAREGA